MVVGQAQIGDIFGRNELSGALASFSIARNVGVMSGPLAGGIMCQLLGWRSTFWSLAIVDSILLLLTIFQVPETLQTPKESRPEFNFWLPT